MAEAAVFFLRPQLRCEVGRAVAASATLTCVPPPLFSYVRPSYCTELCSTRGRRPCPRIMLDDGRVMDACAVHVQSLIVYAGEARRPTRLWLISATGRDQDRTSATPSEELRIRRPPGSPFFLLPRTPLASQSTAPRTDFHVHHLADAGRSSRGWSWRLQNAS